MAKILLVDDELTMVQMVAEVLRGDGHEVFPFTNFNGVPEALASQHPDLVITDLYLERTRPQGLEIVRKARELSPPAAVIMITGFGGVESAVDAMRLGAYDYLEKPFKLEELKLAVHRALEHTEVVAENRQLRRELRQKYQFSRIIGTSSGLQEVFRTVELVADTEATVLILGESGTGKELIARALHYNSGRAHGPFVPINCSALPENLLESELFGHRKGAFTGAVADKEGLFHEADGGTIFLDEIGTMPAQLQSRLLRVLQEREVRRVGDNAPVRVDVRVVAATNEHLEALVKQGKFREDLYYRLNVVAVNLPPLRERRDDIPMLVSHFLTGRIHPRSGETYRVTRGLMAALAAHPWPGNVRELENAIERAALLAPRPVLRAADLPPSIRQAAPGVEGADDEVELASPAGPAATPVPAQAGSAPQAAAVPGSQPLPATLVSLKKFTRNQELAYIQHVLAASGHDKEQAARVLEVSLATLYRKLSEGPE
jgi:DNA-binding NtrC family response regulator